MKNTLSFILIILLLLIPLAGCSSTNRNYAFGTEYVIEIKGKNVQNTQKEIDKLFIELENAISTNNVNSDVYKINQAKQNEPIRVSYHTAMLFKISKQLYAETGGTFNPAIFPLVELWCFSPSTYIGVASKIPSNKEIENLLPYVDFNLFTLDEENGTITKMSNYAKLDFGAIAKGYAVDLAFSKLNNVKKATVDVGRTLRIKGSSLLYVANPRGGDFVASATITNKAVATSGDYERYYELNGQKYHHIIDSSGYPSGIFDENPIISATIVGEDATICDAFSTSAMILGYEKSKVLLEKYNYSALLLTENGYYTIGENIFEIQDARQKLN